MGDTEGSRFVVPMRDRHLAPRLRAMSTLGGKHLQARRGRELAYWCAYAIVDETQLSYVAVINVGLALLGDHEATLRYDPAGIPAKAIVRMNLLRRLDQTSFGVGTLPDPQWVGWYGPYLEPHR